MVFIVNLALIDELLCLFKGIHRTLISSPSSGLGEPGVSPSPKKR